MFRAFSYRFCLAQRAFRSVRARGIAEFSSAYTKKFMTDFNAYLRGSGSRETPFDIMKECSIGLRTELPSGRVSMANHVYSTMREKGLPFTTPLYNSLLQVYLSNRHPFSPVEILSNMQEAGARPNRGTLTLLLKGYCQQGNMTGAKQILTELRERSMTINEEVYAALISGHAQAGDMDSARKMIELMKEGEIPPGPTTYSALLSGYAYNNDFNGVDEVMNELKRERIYTSHSMFTDMIIAASRGGHHEKVPMILDMIRNKEWMFIELFKIAQELSASDEAESSLCVLKCLSSLKLIGEGQANLINVCCAALRNMVHTKRPVDFLLSSASSLATSKESSQIMHNKLIRSLFTNDRWDDGKTVLLEMYKKGLAVKPHFLYPPLAACVQRKDVKGLFEWVNLLTNDLNIDPDMMITDTIIRGLRPTRKNVFQYMKESGIELNTGLVKAGGHICCKLFKYDILYDALIGLDASILPGQFLLETIAFRSKVRPPSVRMLIKFYSLLAKSCTTEQLNPIITLNIRNIPSSDKVRFEFARSLLTEKIVAKLPSDACVLVLSSVNDKKYADEFFEFIALMRVCKIPIDNDHRQQILKLTSKTGAQNAALGTFHRMKKASAVDATAYSNFIVTVTRAKKFNLALKYYKEIMDNPDYKLSFMAYASLIQAFMYRKDFKSAIEIKNKLLALGMKPGRAVYNTFLDGYSLAGDTEKVLAEFDEMAANNIHPNTFSYQKLMQCYARNKNIDGVLEVLQKVLDQGLEISKEIVNSVVEGHLAVGDVSGAFEYLNKYRETKPSLKTFMDCIEASVKQGKTELVDRAVEILKESGYPPETIHHTVIFAMLICGKEDEAFEMARRERLEINLDLVNALAKSCQSSGNVQCIRSLMNMLREFGIKSYPLHIPLMKAYAANNDLEPLLTLMKEFESIGETPRQSSHDALSMLLKKHSKESPFVMAGTPTQLPAEVVGGEDSAGSMAMPIL